MEKIAMVLTLAVPLLMGQMCGTTQTPPPPECLELEDVINIASGTAMGTSLSGTYHGLSSVIDSCVQCSQNTVPDSYCTPPTFAEQTFTVTQYAGTLAIESPEIRMTGRVDQDGSFEVGGVSSPTREDGVRTGQALMLIRGRFEDTLIVGTIRCRLTFQIPDGRTIDLDQVASVTAQRQP